MQAFREHDLQDITVEGHDALFDHEVILHLGSTMDINGLEVLPNRVLATLHWQDSSCTISSWKAALNCH